MEIVAIQTGTVAIKEAQRVGAGGSLPRRYAHVLFGRAWTPPLPIFAWVIAHPEGLIVVDTGETARAQTPGYFPRWHPYYALAVREAVRPEDEIGPQLQAHGFAPEDVRWVVLTHLHTDHAGGIAHFPKAEILVSRTEHAGARGVPGQIQGYLPQHWPDWFAPHFPEFALNPVGLFTHSHALTAAGDVRLVPTPGHTAGHLSVVVRRESDTVFLAGDTSYSEAAMQADMVDGIGPDPARIHATLARIRQFAATTPLIYLPSHDPQSAVRLAARQTVSEDAR